MENVFTQPLFTISLANLLEIIFIKNVNLIVKLMRLGFTSLTHCYTYPFLLVLTGWENCVCIKVWKKHNEGCQPKYISGRYGLCYYNFTYLRKVSISESVKPKWRSANLTVTILASLQTIEQHILYLRQKQSCFMHSSCSIYNMWNYGIELSTIQNLLFRDGVTQFLLRLY